MAIDPRIALQARPFQLESPLAQASQAMSLQNMLQQGDMNRLKMQQAREAQAREQEFRAAIAGAKTPEEQLAVASRFMGPDRLGTMIQSSQDKQSRDKATREMGMLRLTQQAQQFQQNLQARLRTVTNAEERTDLLRSEAAFNQQLQIEKARLMGDEARYNFGFLPQPPPQPTVAPSGPQPLAALQPGAPPQPGIAPQQPLGSLAGLAPPGAQPAPSAQPMTPPSAFPRVTPQMQAGRNVDQRAILQAELANERDPANRAAIEAEIAKLSGPNPFARAGANPLPPANPGQLPQRRLDEIEAARQKQVNRPTAVGAGSAKAEAKKEQEEATIASVKKRVESMSRLVQSNAALVGPAGIARRIGETGMGMIQPGMATPALDYQNELRLLLADVRKVVEKDPNLSNEERRNLYETLGGGTFQTPGSAIRALNNVVNYVEGKKVTGRTPERRTPAVGTVQDGHRFMGGDPSQQDNWQRVP